MPTRNSIRRSGGRPALRSMRPFCTSIAGNGILRTETGGRFWAQNSENGRNSVRRPPYTSLTDRNCEGFCRPGNRVGLPGLHGGAEGIQTDGHRDLTPSGRGIRQNLSGGRFGHPSVQYDAQHFSIYVALCPTLCSTTATCLTTARTPEREGRALLVLRAGRPVTGVTAILRTKWSPVEA